MKRGIVVVEPPSADGTTISKATVRRRIGGLSEEEGWILTQATRGGLAMVTLPMRVRVISITTAGLLRLVAPRDRRCDVMGSRRSVGGQPGDVNNWPADRPRRQGSAAGRGTRRRGGGFP
jgi:hypothetical protein